MGYSTRNYKTVTPSPTETRRLELPQGNADWPGYAVVYDRLQQAAYNLASNKSTYLSNDHIETMAVLGTGHEETMKYWFHVCLNNGWVKI